MKATRASNFRNKNLRPGVLLTLILALIQAPIVLAGPQLGVPAYGGNGCPAGTASLVLSPDGRKANIVFDSYRAEAGGASGRALDRKTCSLAFPIKGSPGFRVGIAEAKYHGYANLDSGATAEFEATYFFAGSRGAAQKKIFNGKFDGDFQVTHGQDVGAINWSECGKDSILRVNTSLVARAGANHGPAEITLDGFDQDGEDAGLRLTYRRCQ